MNMKSLILEKIDCLNYQKTPIPVAGSDEILLKVTHCAVCRTDAKMWKMGQRDLVLPRILGHEICGYEMDGQKRFVAWPGKACGTCVQCKQGTENLCETMKVTGFHKNGGFAEYVTVPESSLISIPDELPGNIAALAEPLACAINALEMINVTAGSKVLIYGAGTAGLLIALAVKEKNANPFIAEINSVKIERSKKFQDKTGIKAAQEFNQMKFEFVINAASSVDTFLNGVRMLKSGGGFCLFSGFTDSRSISADLINEIHYLQLKVTGAYGCTRRQIKEAVKILTKQQDKVDLLIEEYLNLEQVPSVLPKILSGEYLKFIIEL